MGRGAPVCPGTGLQKQWVPVYQEPSQHCRYTRGPLYPGKQNRVQARRSQTARICPVRAERTGEFPVRKWNPLCRCRKLKGRVRVYRSTASGNIGCFFMDMVADRRSTGPSLQGRSASSMIPGHPHSCRSPCLGVFRLRPGTGSADAFFGAAPGCSGILSPFPAGCSGALAAAASGRYGSGVCEASADRQSGVRHDVPAPPRSVRTRVLFLRCSRFLSLAFARTARIYKR